MKPSLNRRYSILLALTVICAGLSPSLALAKAKAPAKHKPPPPDPVILVLGDSISAEYGLKRGTGWVALLEKRLQAENPVAKVINASISGDTSSGGRPRLRALLAQHLPTIVVIELGGNDALRGLPLTMTSDNLQNMTRAAQNAGAKVLLLGMQVPPNYGRDYNNKFIALFAKAAKDNQAALVPFFLESIANGADPLSQFQADRIHPTEAAQPILLETVWPLLQKLML